MSESKQSHQASAKSSDVKVGDVLLALDHVDKRYPGVHALKDVSLVVRSGEVHAIVGENGAGKSTLVGVAAGAVTPNSGTVEIGGSVESAPRPEWCRDQGLAMVYQEPALLPDLTVAENMRLSMPKAMRPHVKDQEAWASGVLANWQKIVEIDPTEPVRNLSADARFVVEIARALAETPRVIILDEPTEHLMPDGVSELFKCIDEVVSRGGAVVYISHKIHEVKKIASTISVLRDGKLEATRPAAELEEQDIIRLVVGHENERANIVISEVDFSARPQLELVKFSGENFADIKLEIRPGEILGFAGIDGQGQRDAIRAIAGLNTSYGDVLVNGKKVNTTNPTQAMKNGIVYVTNDRHREGTFDGLNLRENAAISSLQKYSRFGFVSSGREVKSVLSMFSKMRVKAPSIDVNIESLSGGNQQKVVLSRVLLGDSAVILADEPTQGVDVGAREEIYQILRAAAKDGASIIVLSSSAAELEELCDRVVVFSRGTISKELAGSEVSEKSITSSALTATVQRTETQAIRTIQAKRKRRIFDSDYTPGVVLAVAIVLLGVLATVSNEFYLTPRNFSLVLPLVAALTFFALAQQVVMMIGGIDLSVGPLAGLLVVVASFVLTPETPPFGMVGGVILLIVLAAAVGLLNWFLSTIVKITPFIATLVSATALGGIAFLLRPLPAGSISKDFTKGVTTLLGFVPVIFIAAVLIAIGLELMLKRTLFGLRLRGVGSNPAFAQKVGVRNKVVVLIAYVGCSLLVVPGSFLLMAQSSTGNAIIGNSYTLASIGAVVLGGASIFGGRGSFVGALLGAFLIIQVNTVVQFLGLPAEWQQWFIGGLTLIAAAFYSTSRARLTKGTV